MKLEDREYHFFTVGKIFTISNSTPYHKKDIEYSNDINSIPYITRTNKNNGVELIVDKKPTFSINQAHSIVFGAENATFFYQPFSYITGNKMYIIKNINFNLYNGLFIQCLLNKSVEGCGFSYGRGLTGTREKRRYVALPITDTKKPDYQFMEQYIKNIMDIKKQNYQKYISKKIAKLEYQKMPSLKEKRWKEFFITDIFDTIQRGKRLTKSNQIIGDKPYISSTASNNGVDNFIKNDTRVRIFENCLTIANSGSVGASFYHPYSFVASDHVTHLKKDNMSEYVYLFISTLTNRFKQKYNFNREINDKRISREKILLPIDDNNEPDYEFMQQYIKNLQYKKLLQYAEKANKT